MVRITSDIWDNRGSLETTFRRWEAMQDYTGPEVGSFLDMDMVCFGRLNVVHDNGGWVSHFSADQKRTFMVQRATAFNWSSAATSGWASSVAMKASV